MPNIKRNLVLIIVVILMLSTTSCSLLFPNAEGISIITSYTPTPIPSRTPMKTAAPGDTTEINNTIPEQSFNALLNEKTPKDSSQAILVIVNDDHKAMYCVEKRDDGLWKVVHGSFPVTIGRKGLGKEKEGDGKSPEGVFSLGSAYGYGGAPEECTWPWQEVDADDYWVEDKDSAHYNQYVSLDSVDKDWKAASKLKVSKYERAIEILYNSDNTPGKGSAIFLHVWSGENKSTGGGTASSKKVIETVLGWIKEEANPVLVQVEKENALPKGYGYVVDFAPDVLSDIRFSGEDNFLGRPVKGYEDNAAIVSEAAAKAMDNACGILKNDGFTLMLYDGYRPSQAQEDILSWTREDSEKSTKDRYYPDRTKSEIREDYIKIDEDHCEGASVDVTLYDLNHRPVDMGGTYFFFGRNSQLEGVDLSNAQYNHRELLRDVMVQVGFKPQDNMWWHFDLVEKPFPGESFDFPVK